MEYFLITLFIITLLTIAIQDFRNREFYWFLIPLVFLAGFFTGTLTLTFSYWMVTTLINTAILVLTLSLLYLYFYFSGKKFVEAKEYIGLGDVLLLLALTSFTLPIRFVVLIIISAIASILIHLTVKTRFGKRIPFAGWLSVCTILLFIAEHIG